MKAVPRALPGELPRALPGVRAFTGFSALSQTLTGRVRFEKVTFGYLREKPVLVEVDFAARPGERIALVGPSGAAKSTVVNLLCRFYEPDAGRIVQEGPHAELKDLPGLYRELCLKQFLA